VIRGGKPYAASYLLRGLRIQVTGAGNGDGHLVAKEINFDEDDLRTAQALELTVDPVEAQAEANRKRIEEEAMRMDAAEENAKRMAGQIAEADAAAARAQATADRANDRINGLDEYDSVKTIVVPFATGSFTIGPKGRRIIDNAAAWAKTQDKKGWMVAVIGFADSTGSTAKNKTLSEKRANAVIGYLVSKHNLPVTRLVQPFGAGVDQPVATNATAAGRAQNRRVEIRLLRNKGIAGK
jgi:outer membrane protein OmpA-like peptidoglycan-associated protein